jgi:hypothetical protein
MNTCKCTPSNSRTCDTISRERRFTGDRLSRAGQPRNLKHPLAHVRTRRKGHRARLATKLRLNPLGSFGGKYPLGISLPAHGEFFSSGQ